MGPTHCLQLKRNETDPWQNHYGSIAGFSYEPGFQYKLKVKKTENSNNPLPQDISSFTYTLLEELDKTWDKTVLLNDIWGLTSIDGTPWYNYPGNKTALPPNLEINLANRTLFAQVGCELKGNITLIDGKNIRIDAIQVTDIDCKRDDWLDTVIRRLGQTTQYRIKGRELQLRNDKGPLLTFKKID